MKVRVVDGIMFVQDYRSFWSKHSEAISKVGACVFMFVLAFAWGVAVFS
jgi:predicted cation transporter